VATWRGPGVITLLRADMERRFFFCIMTNPRRTVLYIGVTNNLPHRVYEHKEKLAASFASKYNAVDLVYYEIAETAEAAVTREKQLKAGPRRRTVELINSMNSTWRDLSDEL
jgi:putative endonuclease